MFPYCIGRDGPAKEGEIIFHGHVLLSNWPHGILKINFISTLFSLSTCHYLIGPKNFI